MSKEKDKSAILNSQLSIPHATRPDLEVNVQMPGAYIIRDGKAVPDLSDEAMAKRMEEEMKEKRKKEEMKKEEMKEDLPAEAGSKEEKIDN